MNLGWFGVPPSGGSNGLDRLKPGLQLSEVAWARCTVTKPWRLSMNLPGHRIVAWLGKAALKTHALQTLRDGRASPNLAKRLECFPPHCRTPGQGQDHGRFRNAA